MTVNEEKLKKVSKLLYDACEAYYHSDKPLMTDEDFDRLCSIYKKMTGNFFDTSSYNSKNEKSKKRQLDTKHTFEGLLSTIDNKFKSLDELFEDWLEPMFEKLYKNKNKTFKLYVSEKYDGNSVCIEYDKGIAVSAPTRGENGVGENKIDIFKNEKIGDKEHYIGVKYEVMQTYENFDKLNKFKEDNNEEAYVNSRNTVAGILGKNDSSKYRKYLTLVPLSVSMKDSEFSKDAEIEIILNSGIIPKTDIEYVVYELEGNLKEIKDQIEFLYNDYIEKRDDLNYAIDGLVLEFGELDERKLLGRYANNSPKWQSAVKFPPQEKKTTVKGFVFEASPNGSGKITPSVLIEPVKFNGATMNKISLANYKRFNELKLGVGSKVSIEYRNDVLSYCNKIDCKSNDKIEPYPFTDSCPCCGHPIQLNEKKTFAYCINTNCKMKKIGKINNYINSVCIKGIDISTLEKMYDANLIEDITDLYNLNFIKLSKVEGLGSKSATNIIEAISSVQPDDYMIIAGLGIDNVGYDMAKKILSKSSIKDLCNSEFIESDEFRERLSSTDGIGNIMVERIIQQLSWLTNNRILNYLVEKLDIKINKVIKAENQLTFVHTGDTDPSIFKDRNEIKKYLESFGHKLTSSVSKKTSYLITENPSSGTVKNKKAKELGIPIITCKELKEIVK